MWAASRAGPPPPPPIIISKTSSRPVSHFPVSVSVTFHRQHRRDRHFKAPTPPPPKKSVAWAMPFSQLLNQTSSIPKAQKPIPQFRNQNQNNRNKKNKNKNKKKQKQQEGEERQQLSGSDVLWALTKAAAQNKKKKADVGVGGKKIKKGLNYGVDGSSSSSSSSSNRDGVYEEDYSNVRSLNIKSDWVSRLDDLEKRLKELSEI